MEIQRTHENETLVLALSGRLDATWAESVEAALDAAVRAGEHRIVMDFAGVDYISSAGLRVVIAGYKQLRMIQGGFSVRAAQPGVAKVIELSGLGALLVAPAPSTPAPVAARCFESPRAKWESHGTLSPVRLRAIGGTSAFENSDGAFVEFTSARFGLGVAALAATREDALPRLGEFLCVAGCAAHQPVGGANRPDFLVAEQAFVPGGWISSGLIAEGAPGLLLRFEARAECRGVTLAEIAATALDVSGGIAATFVLAAEVVGLVGASLRQSPAEVTGDPFAFPAIRDRLKFTSERAFRDTTCLAIGVVAKTGSAWDAHLRPFGPDASVLGHTHAVVFPYRPIRKGAIAFDETVRALFEAGGPQAVLHLLNDTREPEGSGDSEFLRGACWVASIAP